MAKPIRATPELRGAVAEEFVNKMLTLEKSKITKRSKDLLKAIESFSIPVY